MNYSQGSESIFHSSLYVPLVILLPCWISSSSLTIKSSVTSAYHYIQLHMYPWAECALQGPSCSMNMWKAKVMWKCGGAGCTTCGELGARCTMDWWASHLNDASRELFVHQVSSMDDTWMPTFAPEALQWRASFLCTRYHQQMIPKWTLLQWTSIAHNNEPLHANIIKDDIGKNTFAMN